MENVGLPGDPRRGLSVAFLADAFLELINAHENPSLTVAESEPCIRYLSRGCCPRDGQEGCAYVDVAPDPAAGAATYMLSYSWGYCWCDIAQVLLSYCSSQDLQPDDARLWICCLCINQHRVKEAQAQGISISFDAFREAFGTRVRSVEHILAMMSPWSNPRYIRRVWCVFEFWTAVQEKKNLTILMPKHQQEAFRDALLDGAILQVYNTLAGIRIQDAEASVEDDRKNILKAMDPAAHDYALSPFIAALNRDVRQKLQSWFVEVAAGQLERQLKSAEVPPLSVHVAIGRLLIEANSDFKRASFILQIGIDNHQGLDHSADIMQAEAEMHLGRCYGKQGNWSTARQYLEHARQTYETLGFTSSSGYGQLLTRLGLVVGKLGDANLRNQLYEQALSVFENCDDANHSPAFAQLLTNLGANLVKDGDLQRGREFLQRAEQAYNDAEASCSPEYAALLTNIGVSFMKEGDAEEKLRYYELSRNAYEAAGAIHSPDFAALLANMGKSYIGLSKAELALQCLNKSKHIYKTMGANRLNTDYADVLTTSAQYCHQLGVCCMNEGKTSQALKHLEDAKYDFELLQNTNLKQFSSLLKNIEEAQRRLSIPDTSSFAPRLGDDSTIDFKLHTEALFERHDGVLGAGDDLLVAQCTLEQAKSEALELPGCQGFTYEDINCDGTFIIFFKSTWNFANIAGMRWISYRMVEPGA